MTLRIPKAELAPEIAEPMTAQFGAVPEPLEVVSHNRKVAESALQFSVLIGGWDKVAEDLKTFSRMTVAAQVGCSWCLDINYFQAQNHNLDVATASQVPRWREADAFTSLERGVLEYSEAMRGCARRSRTGHGWLLGFAQIGQSPGRARGECFL